MQKGRRELGLRLIVLGGTSTAVMHAPKEREGFQRLLWGEGTPPKGSRLHPPRLALAHDSTIWHMLRSACCCLTDLSLKIILSLSQNKHFGPRFKVSTNVGVTSYEVQVGAGRSAINCTDMSQALRHCEFLSFMNIICLLWLLFVMVSPISLLTLTFSTHQAKQTCIQWLSNNLFIPNIHVLMIGSFPFVNDGRQLGWRRTFAKPVLLLALGIA